ncbi:hypothetical protein C8Q80DRAFT_1274996 [Daedaleopsis nitida]|nr:hypothetical protein C8Q80DRAFT_1274996 [Daedaleopsis nitida]
MAAVGGAQSVEVYANMVMRLQLDNQELRDQLRQRDEQIAEYKAAEQLAKRRKSRKKSSTPQPAMADDDDDGLPKLEKDPEMLGKAFVVKHELFAQLLCELFQAGVAPRKPLFEYNSPERYPQATEDGDNIDFSRYEDGLLADLYHHVPASMHHVMRSPKIFQELFTKGVNASRSTVTNRVRSNAPAIYGLDSTIFRKRKPLHPELLRRLKWDLNVEGYPKLPPVLYSQFTLDRNGLFISDTMVNILSVICLGERSITSERTSGTPPVFAKKWGLTKTTPGMIALAATMAVYGCTDDKEFGMNGNSSHIDYRELYFRVKCMLSTMCETTWGKRVFKFYNDRLFPGQNTSPDATSTSHSVARQVDDTPDFELMAQLAAITSGSDEEEPPSPAAGPSHAVSEPPESVDDLTEVRSDQEEAELDADELAHMMHPREVAGVPMSQNRAIIRGSRGVDPDFIDYLDGEPTIAAAPSTGTVRINAPAGMSSGSGGRPPIAPPAAAISTRTAAASSAAKTAVSVKAKAQEKGKATRAAAPTVVPRPSRKKKAPLATVDTDDDPIIVEPEPEEEPVPVRKLRKRPGQQ